jgi:hypothetical protein
MVKLQLFIGNLSYQLKRLSFLIAGIGIYASCDQCIAKSVNFDSTSRF